MTQKGMNARKALLASMIMVLLVSVLPITSVFAASPIGTGGSQTWQTQLRLLRVESAFLTQLQVMPNKFLLAGTPAQQANFKNGFTVTAQQAQGIPVTGGNNTTSSGSTSSGTGTTSSSGSSTTTTTTTAPQGTMTFTSRASFMKWEHAQFMLARYQFAMRQAQTLIANHNGFDANGNMINDRLANQTMKQMAMYLHMMRKIRENFGSL